MLTRAARRKTQQGVLRRLQAPPEPLLLPWLCPALMRWNSSKGASTYSNDPRRPKPTRRLSSRTDTRRLATHTDGPLSANTNSSDPIPFIGNPWDATVETDKPGSVLSELRPWSAPNTILFAPTDDFFRLQRVRGMGGNFVEILQNLFASIRVGRFDRAASLVHRIVSTLPSDHPQVVSICNEYLRGLIDGIRDGKGVTYESVQQWFEVDIRAAGVQPDATTFILMVKACMMSLTGSKQERTLRRYLALAQEVGDDVWAQVISSGEFSGMEWSRLVQLQPQHLHPLPFEPEATLEEDHEDPWAEDLEKGAALASTNRANDSLAPLPTVRAVEQKGLGLHTLKKTLDIFDPATSIPYPDELEGTKEEKDSAWAVRRQRQLEEDVYAAALERWRNENKTLTDKGLSSPLSSKHMEPLLLQWHNSLLPLIKKELRDIKESLDESANWNTLADDRNVYGPFLELFSPEKLATITILGFVNSFVGSGLAMGVKVTVIASKVADILEVEANIQLAKLQKRKKGKSKLTEERLQVLRKLYKGDWSSISQTKDHSQRTKRKVTDLAKSEWPKHVKVRIGAMLIQQIIDAAKVTVTRTDPRTGNDITLTQPAFSHTYVFKTGRKIGMIKAHHNLVEQMGKEPVKGALGARLPMVCKPRPWTGMNEGGYLLYPVPVVRQKERDAMQRLYVQAATDNGDLDQVFAGLEVLGKTPWKINRDVLRVMLEVWNSGEGLARIAPEKPGIEVPQKPDVSAGAVARAKWFKLAKQIDNHKTGLHSERCFQNFQLEIARSFADEVFYFPHNLDFRGRAYPISPYLNHMGADFARGMLQFAEGRELGEVGLAWLKVHLANVFGFDKASLSERENFATEHLDDIYDSAENPLNGRRWWLKAEDPWQCLAACMDLTNALKSGDPARYVSHTPVHQDGTCNGLQHYAALGGDEAGASQVNLKPGDRPADIYSAIADIVKSYIAADAEAGHPLAHILEGKINRKIVKQPVMTNVYGVTFIGARAQVQKQLEDAMPDYVAAKHEEEMLFLATYITRYIFKALSTMFSGATDIQKWLGRSADLICLSVTPEQIAAVRDVLESNGNAAIKVPNRKPRANSKNILNTLTNILKFKSTVVWTTPLKLPVVQPYRVNKSFQAYTSLQQVAFTDQTDSDPVHKRKQLQAFPPNFIHSLDATHMLLSALKSDELGLTFASVHDSFWTHAADVPKLNTILRDAFIRMHSEDVMGRIAEEFNVRYKDCLYLKTIPGTSAVAGAIKNFRKENGLRGFDGGVRELIMENDRQKLLQSEDPAERRLGQQMVTPATIYQAWMQSDTNVPLSEPLDMALLGALPKSGATAAPKRVRGRPSKAVMEAAEEEENLEATDLMESDVLTGPISTDNADVPLADMLAGEAIEQQTDESTEADSKVKQMHKNTSVNIWLPLTFPELPKKGTFDVQRLRESKYFFS